MAIVYAVVAQQSLGELLIGSVFPGLLLSGLYVGYVTLRCYINPALGPALPIEERVSLREKLRLLRSTITPVLLILLVLGVIFFGIATPVEAAGIGTFGAFVVCALHRRLNWANVSRRRDRHAEGDRDGDVDLLRRDDVRRLLHRQGRPDVRHRAHPRHRPARPTACCS